MNQGYWRQLHFVPVNCTRKKSGFAFDLTGRKFSATQAPPFIRHIIMPDMHQSARFARQGMLNGHLGSAAITGSRHIQRKMVVP
jgi:hypothetical protein